jgi:adenosyl cobinamide kinase/adenosyl cobinamide phosphate guanylyltransferase
VGGSRVTLVLGGARSGKSEFAERLAGELGTGVTYLATAAIDPADTDHRRRIEAHRARRPSTWTTREVGAELADALREVHGPVLVDSLGTWITTFADFGADPALLCAALTERDGPSVVVSEEVGFGVHPETEVGRRFRDALGDVNQAVAAISADAYLVVAGRPLHLP